MNKALVNYYARLIKKNVYTMENVPEENREDVLKAIELLEASSEKRTEKTE